MKSKIFTLFFLLILFIFLTAKSYANSIFTDLSSNIFRLHILANSDSEDDQQLKLRVRDEVLKYIKNLIQNCNTKDEVIGAVTNHLEDLYNISRKVISDNGYNYDIKIEIGNFYFPTKYYSNISMPSGNYDALRIKIGKSEGHNWWCSLFPALCFTDISNGMLDSVTQKKLEKTLSKEENQILFNSTPNIKFKFKIIEFFNK